MWKKMIFDMKLYKSQNFFFFFFYQFGLKFISSGSYCLEM